MISDNCRKNILEIQKLEIQIYNYTGYEKAKDIKMPDYLNHLIPVRNSLTNDYGQISSIFKSVAILLNIKSTHFNIKDTTYLKINVLFI